MSTAAANVKSIAAGKVREVKPGQLFVVGKIQDSQKFQTKSKETRYRTRVLMKNSADDFAYPMPFDIVSNSSLGAVGEIWEGTVDARTFRKDYTTKPDEDGEFKKIWQVTLDCYLPE